MQSCGNAREMHTSREQRRRVWKWEQELEFPEHLLNCALINHRHRHRRIPFVLTYFYSESKLRQKIERDEKINANLCTFHGQRPAPGDRRKKLYINLSRRVNLIHFIKCFSANHLSDFFLYPGLPIAAPYCVYAAVHAHTNTHHCK